MVEKKEEEKLVPLPTIEPYQGLDFVFVTNLTLPIQPG